MTRKQVTDNKLIEALRHLGYEFWMLRTTSSLLSRSQEEFKIMGQGIGNAVLESFAVHARSLTAFFHVEPRKDDVCLGDFLQQPAVWSGADYPGLLSDWYDRTSKQIAHVTYQRLDYDESELHWPFEDIRNLIEADLDKLLSLPTRLKAPLLEQYLFRGRRAWQVGTQTTAATTALQSSSMHAKTEPNWPPPQIKRV